MNDEYLTAIIKLREFKNLINVGPNATLYCAGLDDDLKDEVLDLFYAKCDIQIERMEAEIAKLELAN